MKFRNRVILAASVVGACLVMGTAGVVAAAGVQGKGPASVLSNLVADGTLTQEQADKVADAFEKEREEMRERGQAQRTEMQELIAGTLGITVEELEQAQKEGKSLKEIAGDKRDALIDALAAHMDAQIDKALADGRITQQQADKAKARSKEMATKRVDAEGGRFGLRHRGGPGGPGGLGGPGGPGGPAADGEGPPEGAPPNGGGDSVPPSPGGDGDSSNETSSSPAVYSA